ncbi:MAG: S41 family peptidase [Limisphaerales bacterium]
MKPPIRPRHPASLRLRPALFGWILPLLVGVRSATCLPAAESKAPAWPPVAELSAKLRLELPTLPAPDASFTNSEAYAQSLAPWVLSSPPDSGTNAVANPILKSRRYSGDSGYLRIGTVDSTLAGSLRDALTELAKEGPLAGLVLDLRFASGADLGSGVVASSAVASKSDPVEFKLGEASWKTQPNDRAPKVPVLVLVNRATRQAAELFASAVRASAAKSLVLGAPTAGQARTYRPVAVSESVTLQVAGDAVRLPDGSEFPASGLAPDLAIQVPEEDERAYATDEFRRVVKGQAMASSGGLRLNEAELVRRRRQPESHFDLDDVESSTRQRISQRTFPVPADRGSSAPGEAVPHAVQDPVLAVALDLISGLAADEARTGEVAAGQPSPGE